MIRILFLLVGSALACAAQAKSGLTRLLEGELSRFPAKAGVCVKQLTTGEEACVKGDEAFNSYSVIKLGVMLRAYQLADKRQLDLDSRVTMGMGDYRGGSGILQFHGIGQMPSIRDLVTEMVITSDNSATDLLIAKVGGVAAVNQTLAENAYRNLRLNRTVYEFFRRFLELMDPKYKSLTPEEVYAIQSNNPVFRVRHQALIDEVAKLRSAADPIKNALAEMKTDPSRWLGSMTPRETMRLVESFEKGTAASKEACAEMIRIMLAQQSGARRLPHFLSVPVAHKTGDGPPSVANDVGIIYAKSGPIAIAFFSSDNTGVYGETEDRIGEVARMIVEYFDGVQ